MSLDPIPDGSHRIQGPGPSSNEAIPPIPGSSDDSLGPFRKMFGGMMDKKEFTQFINQFMKDMVSQFKQADARWKEAMDRMKRADEGDD